MNKPTICRYCGGKVILTDSSKIYGKDYGDIYLCTICNAFVGVHKGSGKPLGTLANSILRTKRKETHEVFDKFWKDNHMSRTEGYKWLSEKMGLPFKSTHIGYFEIEECQKVIELCQSKAA